MALGHTLSQQLQATLRKADHLALVIILDLGVRLNLPVGNLLDHFHNTLRLADKPNELLVLRLEQLKQGPDRNVLKRGVAASQEPAEIAVDAVARLGPVLDEYAVISHWS